MSENTSTNGTQAEESVKRGLPKFLEGKVVSTGMDKTAVVLVETRKKHPVYKKYIKRSTKYPSHDENSTCNVGDVVRIIECRPLSKTKRWRIYEILEKAV